VKPRWRYAVIPAKAGISGQNVSARHHETPACAGVTRCRARQTARSSSIFLVSAIALAGFKPFGQALAQFMIVWQR
jgi:hypothetical protein